MNAKRLGYVCAVSVAIVIASSSPVHALCNQRGPIPFTGYHFYCDDEGHQKITDYIGPPLLRPAVFADIVAELQMQDADPAADLEAIHFDACNFEEGSAYINAQYQRVIDRLAPSNPDIFSAPDEFGRR